jgi:hypothetical protein
MDNLDLVEIHNQLLVSLLEEMDLGNKMLQVVLLILILLTGSLS